MSIVLKSKEEKRVKDPLDRNKSDLTHKITALAAAYLSGFGCKPVETEVPHKGFIVDVGGFAYPTMTELKNSKLLNAVFPEFKGDHYAQYNRFFQQYGEILTVGVEVKISSQDFKKDLDRKYSQGYLSGITLGLHLCFLAVPKSLEEEVSKVGRWGFIICSEDGEKILKVKPPQWILPMNPGDIISFVSQIAIRRDHRTRYAALRDWLKCYRLKK